MQNIKIVLITGEEKGMVGGGIHSTIKIQSFKQTKK